MILVGNKAHSLLCGSPLEYLVISHGVPMLPTTSCMLPSVPTLHLPVSRDSRRGFLTSSLHYGDCGVLIDTG